MLTFCIRDDDTNYFTTPDDLEYAYGAFWHHGPISLAVIPFQKGCKTKNVPIQYRTTNEIYPIGENRLLVSYLKKLLQQGKIEIVLHGYHHEDIAGKPEFVTGGKLKDKVHEGKIYLEKIFNTPIRVFVPPHNSISRVGLQAVIHAKLSIGCFSGLRMAWPLTSWRSWSNWARIKLFLLSTQQLYPYTLNLGSHREIIGHAVTPSSDIDQLKKSMVFADRHNGVFCLATHYWEYDVCHNVPGVANVREQIQQIIELFFSLKQNRWLSLGDTLHSKG